MRAALVVLTLILYALHQDTWLWEASRPLTFGVLPPGLAYHATYTLVIALWMGVLVRLTWPAHLDRE